MTGSVEKAASAAAAAAARTNKVYFGSSVGGGPLSRLVPHLEQARGRVELAVLYSPEAWRSWMTQGRAGRLWARLTGSVTFPLLFVAKGLRDAAPVYVPTTNPPWLPFWCVITAWAHGGRVIPLIYDLYPDALEAAGVVKPSSAVSRLATVVNRYWMRRVDGAVFIGHAMRAHSLARYGTPARHIVIETGADAQEFDPEKKGAAVVFSYVGNMGAMHDWETLAGALAKADAKIAAAGGRVVIAASGAGAQQLRETLTGATSVEFLEPLADEQWRELMEATHVALVTLRTEAAMTCVPSKAFSALAAGSALLAVAPPESDLAALVQDGGCGECIAPGDVDGLAEALIRMGSSPEESRRYRCAARAAAVEHFDVKALARKWTDFIDSMAPRKPSAWYPIAKRVLDVCVASASLALFSPAIVAAGVATLLESGRPVFFFQERPGLHGRPFKLVKLRTMRPPQTGEDGPATDEVRLTRVGRFLRATSIDELPSLWNIVRGEMSLVGPRPLLTSYLSRYSSHQARRHEVLPGLTGWAQVNGRNALSWKEKFDLDVWYVDHRSFLLDLHILFRTALTVLRRDGISQDGHVTMPEFMGTEEIAA